MAEAKEPTKAQVLGIAQRLQDLYAADELGHLEQGELFGAVRELHILARRAGFELDDNHPVQAVVETIYEYDEDLATDMLDDVRAMELRDRQQLADAEAAVARDRAVNTSAEILARSGAGNDELRGGMIDAVMRVTPAPNNAEDAIETTREIERQTRATAKSIEDADLRTEILSELRASQSPFGAVHQSQRRQAIQDHAVATSDWSGDSAEPVLTHEETMEAKAVAKGEILAASQGPRALRSYREEHGINLDEYA